MENINPLFKITKFQGILHTFSFLNIQFTNTLHICRKVKQKISGFPIHARRKQLISHLFICRNILFIVNFFKFRTMTDVEANKVFLNFFYFYLLHLGLCAARHISLNNTKGLIPTIFEQTAALGGTW